MKPGLHTTLDNLAKVAAGIEKLATTRVMVGVPAEEGSRKDGGPINNAALAYIHDNGAPEAGIPQRQFLKPGIEDKKAEIAKGFEKAGQMALNGEAAVENQFHRVGALAQSAVKKKITDGPFVPLAEETIAARRRRGRTGTKPLIDTRQLTNAITYVIRQS